MSRVGVLERRYNGLGLAWQKRGLTIERDCLSFFDAETNENGEKTVGHTVRGKLLVIGLRTRIFCRHRAHFRRRTRQSTDRRHNLAGTIFLPGWTIADAPPGFSQARVFTMLPPPEETTNKMFYVRYALPSSPDLAREATCTISAAIPYGCCDQMC